MRNIRNLNQKHIQIKLLQQLYRNPFSVALLKVEYCAFRCWVANSKGMYDLLTLFPPAAVTRSELSVFFSFLTLGMRDVLLYTSLRQLPDSLLFFESAAA